MRWLRHCGLDACDGMQSSSEDNLSLYSDERGGAILGWQAYLSFFAEISDHPARAK